jgi:hypothetical protein
VLCKDDWTILKRFCSIINVELTIYTILSDHEYERVEFCSPKSGIVVDVYQRLTSAGALEYCCIMESKSRQTTCRLLSSLVTPFACNARSDKVKSVRCDLTHFEPRMSMIPRRPQEVSPLQVPRKLIVEESKTPGKADQIQEFDRLTCLESGKPIRTEGLMTTPKTPCASLCCTGYGASCTDTQR